MIVGQRTSRIGGDMRSARRELLDMLCLASGESAKGWVLDEGRPRFGGRQKGAKGEASLYALSNEIDLAVEKRRNEKT